MLGNIIFRSGLVGKIQFGFSKFVTNNDMKNITRWKGKFMGNRFLKDDLFFSNETSQYDGGIEQVAKTYKQNPDSSVSIKGHTILLYHLAKNQVHDPECYKLLEEHLFNFKEQYTPRLAYGGLYAVYSSNQSSQYAITFFEEEYSRTIEQQGPHSAARILIAIGNNKVKSLEHRRKYASQYLVNIIKANYKKFIAHQYSLELKIYDALIKLELFEPEIWELILGSVRSLRTGNVMQVTKLYTDLIDLQNSKIFFRDLTPEIDFLKSYIQKNSDFTWKYDLENNRFKTYDEIVKHSESYNISKRPYLERTIGVYHTKNIQAHEEYQKFKENRIEKQSEEIIKEKQKDLQNLLYEQFMLKQLGEDINDANTSQESEDAEYESSNTFDIDKDITGSLKSGKQKKQPNNKTKQ